MKRGGILFCMLGILIAVALCAGCTGQSYGRSHDGMVVPVKAGDSVRIRLAENPSTGFIWNATTTGDLTISRTEYEGDVVGEMMGMVGGGGSRSWDLVIGNDKVQKFSAVYRRPGEPENRTLDRFGIAFAVG